MPPHCLRPAPRWLDELTHRFRGATPPVPGTLPPTFFLHSNPAHAPVSLRITTEVHVQHPSPHHRLPRPSALTSCYPHLEPSSLSTSASQACSGPRAFARLLFPPEHSSLQLLCSLTSSGLCSSPFQRVELTTVPITQVPCPCSRTLHTHQHLSVHCHVHGPCLLSVCPSLGGSGGQGPYSAHRCLCHKHGMSGRMGGARVLGKACRAGPSLCAPSCLPLSAHP